MADRLSTTRNGFFEIQDDDQHKDRDSPSDRANAGSSYSFAYRSRSVITHEMSIDFFTFTSSMNGNMSRMRFESWRFFLGIIENSLDREREVAAIFLELVLPGDCNPFLGSRGLKSYSPIELKKWSIWGIGVA
jgi:hypothetical protein